MLSLFGSIVLIVVVFCLMGSAEQKFAGKVCMERVKEIDADFPFKFKASNLVKNGWTRAFVFAIVLGVVNFLTPKLPALGPVFLGVMICLFVYLMYRWYDVGKTFSGMLAFAGIALMAFFTALATADKTVAALSLTGGWKKLFFLIPPGLLITTIGFFIFDVLDFKSSKLADEAEKVKNPKKAELLQRSKLARWASRGVVVVLILTLLVGGLDAAGFNLPSWLGKKTETAEAKEPTVDTAKAESVASTAATAIDEPWYHFYNTDLQDNGKPEDDFNFGVNPIEPNTKAETYDREFRYRMSLDPALGAADMAWWDSITGTRFLGEFYESCKGDWAKTMNRSKENWMKDQSKYYETLKAFNKTLDRATVRIETREGGLDDQMYMSPDTPNGVPDIVVMETLDHNGTFLVYEITIKERKFEIAYRIDCGYQPTNVAKIMKITPQPNPNPPPQNKENPPGGNTPGGGGGGGGGGGNPTPKKDKTKGTQGDLVKPNDNPGPGENTNNPSNPNQSTADEGDDRSDDGDLNDYNDEIGKIEDANDGTSTGGEPSTPSTGGTGNVDDNAGTGTSTSAPIDTPTTVSPPAQTANGTQISTEPGEAWGGLSD